MKPTELPVIAITVAVVALAQGSSQQTAGQCLMCRTAPAPVAAPAERLGSTFTGDSIEALVQAIKKKSVPKSEFETTAAYEARLNGERRDEGTFVFVLDQRQFSYDADAEMMTASISMNKRKFSSEPDHPEYWVLSVRHVLGSRTEYVGSNAFGVEAAVSSTISQDFSVILEQSLEPDLFLPMNPTTAQDVKPHLRTGLTCTLSSDKVFQDFSRHEPTISDPIDDFITYSFVPVTVREMFVFDKRDGTVLLRVHYNEPADLATQREYRDKMFPIELEVEGNSLLYVSIDGGSEEAVFENAVIKAKHQLNLRLKSQFDQVNLRLNGRTFRPAWSIHNREIGSLSMFDYAEANISNTEVQQELRSAVSRSHFIGETFQEWLVVNQIDLAVLCRENKKACKQLRKLRRVVMVNSPQRITSTRCSTGHLSAANCPSHDNLDGYGNRSIL